MLTWLKTNSLVEYQERRNSCEILQHWFFAFWETQGKSEHSRDFLLQKIRKKERFWYTKPHCGKTIDSILKTCNMWRKPQLGFCHSVWRCKKSLTKHPIGCCHIDWQSCPSLRIGGPHSDQQSHWMNSSRNCDAFADLKTCFCCSSLYWPYFAKLKSSWGRKKGPWKTPCWWAVPVVDGLLTGWDW